MEDSAKFFLRLTLILGIAGCASSYLASNKPVETVVATSDGMQVKPPWINEAVPFRSEQGQITALGIAQIPSDFRIESGYGIARMNAERRLARELEERMEVMSDNPDVADQAGYLGNKAVASLSSILQPGPKYWEKIKIQTVNDTFEVYRLYTTVSVSDDAYKKAVFSAADQTQEKNLNGMSANFPKVLGTQWPKLVGPASEVKSIPELHTQDTHRMKSANSANSTNSAASAGNASTNASTPEQQLNEHLQPALVALPGPRNPASMPAAVIVEGKYTVQVSAFTEEQRAQNLVGQLKGKGLDAYYVPATVKGQQFYRVSVGQFKNRADAVHYSKETNLKDLSHIAFVRKNAIQ